MRLVNRWADEEGSRRLSRPLVLIALAIVLSTAALCSYDRFAVRQVSAADARASIANGSAEAGAVVVLLRETRANIDALKHLAAQPGYIGDQATAALIQIHEKAQ